MESDDTKWNFHENIFNLDESFFEGFRTFEIRISVGKNYAAFKFTSQNAIYLIANCQYNSKFDSETYSCVACEHAGLTWGVQST